MQFNIIVIIITISGIINLYGGVVVKSYTIELTDELSVIYEDIAKMNEKKVEDCLVTVSYTHLDVYKRQEEDKAGGQLTMGDL